MLLNQINQFIEFIYLPHTAWVGCYTRSIFQRSLIGLNFEFSFSETGCDTKSDQQFTSCSKENTWIHTFPKSIRADGNYTKMLRTILNKSWRQHLTKQQLYGHLPPITKTIKAEPDMRDTAGEVGTLLISDLLLWTSSHGREKTGWPTRTYVQQL